MQLVETILRPLRVAWVLPTEPSSRAANRTFRLATGRWGGRFDVIIQRDTGRPLSPFASSALRLTDPDLIISVDRRLGAADWSHDLARLRLQPFDVVHLSERTGRRGSLYWLGSSPTISRDDDPVVVRAESGSAFDWRRAAMYGLVSPDDTRMKASSDSDTGSALDAMSAGIAQRVSLGRAVLFGPPDVLHASHFWTLRALGARVTWLRLPALAPNARPPLNRRGALQGDPLVSAPTLDDQELGDALRAAGVTRFRLAIEQLRQADQLNPPEYARQALAVSPHRERLHLALPVPDAGGRALNPMAIVAAEHRLRSLDPHSPDGVVLSRDKRSRDLLARDINREDVRVGAHGIVARQKLGDSSLQAVPLIGFWDAVAAPLAAAGYEVTLSDKGRFQTMMLEQAKGLRFLAWTFSQAQSRDLLALFDEHHLNQKAAAHYRRSATFADIVQRLQANLRSSGRLTSARALQATEWLQMWTDQLLEREMLVGGFHLKCPSCLLGTFYPAERINAWFVCERCGARNVVPGDAERRHRLGELFHMLRFQNGDVVTLVLSWLRSTARESFMYLPEINLFKGGVLAAEADFAALVDGRLVVGEAKSNREISRKELGRLFSVAHAAGASRVVVATLTSRNACGSARCDGCALDGEPRTDHVWSPKTRELLRRSADAIGPHGVEIVTLDHDALLAGPAARLGELAYAREAVEAT